jgi:hypothetical protein
MSSYFSEKQIAELYESHSNANQQFATLRQRFLVRQFKSGSADEHAKHGFSRRLGTLIRVIDLVFQQLPPESADIPDRDTTVDATIAIQSFVLNTFGCLDNLAWIWVLEKRGWQRS